MCGERHVNWAGLPRCPWCHAAALGSHIYSVRLKMAFPSGAPSHLQSFCFVYYSSLALEKAMAPHSSTLAWKIQWTEEPGRLQSTGSLRVGHDWATSLSLHFPALEKEMATHSTVLAWRIPGTEKPGGLLSMGSHRVGHDWSDLAAAAAVCT